MNDKVLDDQLNQGEQAEDVQPGNSWGDMAQEFGLDFGQVEGVETVEAEQTAMAPVVPPATDEEKLFAAEAVVLTGLKFVVSTLFDLEVPDKKYEELATSTARVIVKRYKGGIFEFLAAWREELAFCMAMLAFVAATREAVKVKKAKEVKADKSKEGGDDAGQA